MVCFNNYCCVHKTLSLWWYRYIVYLEGNSTSNSTCRIQCFAIAFCLLICLNFQLFPYYNLFQVLPPQFLSYLKAGVSSFVWKRRGASSTSFLLPVWCRLRLRGQESEVGLMALDGDVNWLNSVTWALSWLRTLLYKGHENILHAVC